MRKNEYIKAVTDNIQNKKWRRKAAKELSDHIDDRTDYFLATGMSAEEAEEAAVGKMGDAKEVGQEMNELHKTPLVKKLFVIFLIFTVAVSAASCPLWLDYTLSGKKYVEKVNSGDTSFVGINYGGLCKIDLQRLGTFTDYSFRLHHEADFFFSADSYILTAEYTTENYKKQCDYINKNCTFRDIAYYDKDNKSVVIDKVGIDNFTVRAILTEPDDYPNHIKFIGFNDAENKIAYFDFHDSDIDYMTDIDEFFRVYFKM